MGVLAKPIPFGDYFLLEKINTGGMAEVFKAKTFGVEGFERIVAVKKILPSIAEDKEFISMFIDEAKIAGQLTHANIAQIFDLGNINGDYYIALEYVPGHDLRVIFDRCVRMNRKLDIGCVCYIVSKICEGLDYAHNKKDANGQPMNIIHRDISPQNILLSYEGECKLIDFGIAKATNKSSATQVGILKGKFSYMSPEQVSGKPNIDRRSDIFALGIVLFEMLTLKRLFLGDSDFETLEKIRKVEVSPPTLYNSDIPEELESIVLKALEKDPDDRFQTAAEFQEALQRFMFKQDIFYTAKELSEFCHSMFAQEIALEQKKMEFYRDLTPEVLAQSKKASSDSEDDTSFYERQNLPRMSGVQYEAVSSAAQTKTTQPAPKEAILSELDDFQPPTNDIVYSQKTASPAPQNTQKSGSQQEQITQPQQPGVTRPETYSEIINVPMVQPRRSARRSIVSQDIVSKQSDKIIQENSGSGFKWIAVLLAIMIIGLVGYAAFIRYDQRNGKLQFSVYPADVKVRLEIDDRQITDKSGDSKLISPINVENCSVKKDSKYRVVAEGYEPVEGVVLASDEVQTINIQLQPVNATTLKFNVNIDDADVFMDGQKLEGNRNFDVSNITPGDHRVTVSKAGYKSEERTISIQKGEQLSQTFDLHPASAVLLLRTDPYAAKFKIVNKRTGQTVREGSVDKNGIQIADLPIDDIYDVVIVDGSDKVEQQWIPNKNVALGEAQYLVIPTKNNPNQPAMVAANDENDNNNSATKPEPETKQQPAEKDKAASDKTDKAASDRKKSDNSKKTETKTTNTQPKTTDSNTQPKPDANVPGTLKIASKPQAKNVYVNGKDYGETPIEIKDLAPGSYTIRFVNNEEGFDVEQKVTLAPGEVKRVMRR